MSLQLEIEEKPDYLVATFSGTGNLYEVTRQFPSMAGECRSRSKSRLLINIAGAQMDLSVLDRYAPGRSAAVFGRNGIRVAAVGTPEQLDPQRLAEVVANNRGVTARVFADVENAVEWLLKDHPV